MLNWLRQIKHAILYALRRQRIKQVAPGKYQIRIKVMRVKK